MKRGTLAEGQRAKKQLQKHRSENSPSNAPTTHRKCARLCGSTPHPPRHMSDACSSHSACITPLAYEATNATAEASIIRRPQSFYPLKLINAKKLAMELRSLLRQHVVRHDTAKDPSERKGGLEDFKEAYEELTLADLLDEVFIDGGCGDHDAAESDDAESTMEMPKHSPHQRCSGFAENSSNESSICLPVKRGKDFLLLEEERHKLPLDEMTLEAKMAFEKEKAEIMTVIPLEHKGMFGQIGFAKMNKTMIPVLVLSPYDVPPKLRKQWIDMFHNLKKQGRLASLAYLIFWYDYGPCDSANRYSFIQQQNFTPFEEGVKQGYDKLPPDVQKRLDNNVSLAADRNIIRAFKEMRDDLTKDPSERKRGVEDFQEAYEELTLSDVCEDIHVGSEGEVEQAGNADSNQDRGMIEKEWRTVEDLQRGDDTENQGNEFSNIGASKQLHENDNGNSSQKGNDKRTPSDKLESLSGEMKRNRSSKQGADTKRKQDFELIFDSAVKGARSAVKASKKNEGTKTYIEELFLTKELLTEGISGSMDRNKSAASNRKAERGWSRPKSQGQSQTVVSNNYLDEGDFNDDNSESSDQASACLGDMSVLNASPPPSDGEQRGDMDVMKAELRSFRKCEEDYANLVNCWSRAIESKDCGVLLSVLRKVSEFVEFFPATFIEAYDVRKLLNKTQLLLVKTSDIEFCHCLRSTLRENYRNKRRALPQNFFLKKSGVITQTQPTNDDEEIAVGGDLDRQMKFTPPNDMETQESIDSKCLDVGNNTTQEVIVPPRLSTVELPGPRKRVGNVNRNSFTRMAEAARVSEPGPEASIPEETGAFLSNNRCKRKSSLKTISGGSSKRTKVEPMGGNGGVAIAKIRKRKDGSVKLDVSADFRREGKNGKASSGNLVSSTMINKPSNGLKRRPQSLNTTSTDKDEGTNHERENSGVCMSYDSQDGNENSSFASDGDESDESTSPIQFKLVVRF